MDEKMKLNDALSAEVRVAATGADAAPKGAKTYVKPAMQVFELDCGLLVGSGVTAPPVQVTLIGTIDMYNFYGGDWQGDYQACSGYLPDEVTCADYKKANFMMDRLPYVQGSSTTDFGRWTPCFKNSETYVMFGEGGEGWDALDFLANVQILGDCSLSPSWNFHINNCPVFYGEEIHCESGSLGFVSGEYRGQPVEIDLQLGIWTDRD
ncbi:MAG: hypothetical protein IJ722_04115 [Alloprevotella sp.]|nr:hypothetical protein [Alloprevotella sp.]